MGKKSKRKRERQQKLDDMFQAAEDANMADVNEPKMSAKQSSKLRKKERKRLLRQMMHMKDKATTSDNSKTKMGWHKIVIKGDDHLDKNFILTSIKNILEVEFRALGFFRMENTSCFYLENNTPAANAMSGLDKRLQGPSGSRLRITSSKCDGPDLILNADQLEVMKICLSNRYNVNSHLLDLTDLHNDAMLIERDLLTPLQTPTIMKQVMKLVKENVPELKALSLSKNGLKRSDLHHLNLIHNGCSQLAALNLENNSICDLKFLNIVKMFPLTELNLKCNPICDSFKDRPLAYINEVKSRLANLKLLDSIDIEVYLANNEKPSPHVLDNINFSKNEKIMCESSNNFVAQVTDATVRAFLDQYYKLVDTHERCNLVAAYTPDAVLEVKSNIDFISNNLFVGHDKIREALVLLPATQHDHSSFNLLIQPLGPKNTRAEVTGQCQVAGVNIPVAFLHIMNIVPFNAGFCCSEDKLELKVITT